MIQFYDGFFRVVCGPAGKFWLSLRLRKRGRRYRLLMSGIDSKIN